MKVAHVAGGFGIDVEFHAPGPAQLHCIATTRNSNYYEMALVHPKCQNTAPPVYKGDYEDQLDSIDADGMVPIPEGPGLGVDYDWEYIENNQTGSVLVYE